MLLWNEYDQRGDEKALETLLAYNVEDVVNLETLTLQAYNMKVGETPFARSHRIELPGRPEIPFRADGPTLERLRRHVRVFRSSG